MYEAGACVSVGETVVGHEEVEVIERLVMSVEVVRREAVGTSRSNEAW